MKKRVVAILLSLTMCSATVTQAGAADFSDSAAVTEIPSSAGTQTGEAQTEVPDAADNSGILVEESEDYTGTESPLEGTEIPDAGDVSVNGPEDSQTEGNGAEAPTGTPSAEPQVDFSEDLFTSGENVQETEPQAAPQINTMAVSPVKSELYPGEGETEGKITVSWRRWYHEDGRRWKLGKLPETAEASEEDRMLDADAEVLDGTAADEGSVSAPESTESTGAAEPVVVEMTPETYASMETAENLDVTAEQPEAEVDFGTAPEMEPEAETAPQPETTPEAETAPQPETIPETEPEVLTESQVMLFSVPAEQEYYKNALLEVTTVDDEGKALLTSTYYFDQNGNMQTGIRKIQPGTEGFLYEEAAEYFLQFSGKAKRQNEFEAEKDGKKDPSYLTPYNSDMGRMQTNTDYIWMKGLSGKYGFHKYGEDGRGEDISGVARIQGSDRWYYYYLGSDGVPFVGVRKTVIEEKEAYYCFAKAKPKETIPGKMMRNNYGWLKTSDGGRWLYFGADGANEDIPAGVYPLRRYYKDNTKYLIDGKGYLIKNKAIKTKGNIWYMGDKTGKPYMDRVVKWNGTRYYWGKDGKLVNWTNRWISVPNGNKKPLYYYLGNRGGRVQEKKGIQKVVLNGKYKGWFYFDSNGNNVQNKWVGDRYFTADGTMASGPVKVGHYTYFFERSTSSKYYGNKYKNKWIKYNNRYYHASMKGMLQENGWHTINGGRYFFENCKTVTGKSMKDPQNGKWGWLDPSQYGKHTYGWIAYASGSNLARYVDPKTGTPYKNTTKWIDGMQYRFDSNGNRVTDRTSEFRRSRYYLSCDRVNGVMTVYADSGRTIPIKSIRVSVGLPSTPTWKGTYTLYRSQRWQPLMGPSWGQYGTHVSGCGQGGIFVHSVASPLQNGNNLPVGEYNRLGNPASHGCIRCCVADAKWVYENCNGSQIYIFDGSYKSNECFKGPLGRNRLVPVKPGTRYDPTDPMYNR